MLRTSVPGHPSCQRPDLIPYGSVLNFDSTRYGDIVPSYNLGMQAGFNHILLTQANNKQIHILDIFPMTVLRPDGHLSEDTRADGLPHNDCIRYSLPGPIDWWNHLLFSNLKDLANTNTTTAGSSWRRYGLNLGFIRRIPESHYSWILENVDCDVRMVRLLYTSQTLKMSFPTDQFHLSPHANTHTCFPGGGHDKTEGSNLRTVQSGPWCFATQVCSSLKSNFGIISLSRLSGGSPVDLIYVWCSGVHTIHMLFIGTFGRYSSITYSLSRLEWVVMVEVVSCLVIGSVKHIVL